MAALAFIATACGSPAITPGPIAAKNSPGPLASPSSAPGPSSLIVFLKPGAMSLVRPDGSVADVQKTQLDSGDVAQHEYDQSDAALVGTNGALGFAVYDRDGAVSHVGAAAAKVLNEVDLLRSPIIVAGHDLLVIKAGVPDVGPPTSTYIKLDLASGKVTPLLTATSLPDVLPPGALGGEPHEVDMEPLGTTGDGLVARLMVVHALVKGVSITGAAYYDINLQSLAVTGPHALPSVGTIAISADARYAAWSELRVVDNKGVRDLHILELAAGREATISKVPFVNEAPHGGIKFSPDGSYVSLQGYGAGSMGFAVFDLRSNRIVQSVVASQPDGPLADVPLWWTDTHTVVYQTTAFPAGERGHRLDVLSGATADYPAELGVPVLVFAQP
jgi:hypothetical protein